MSLEFHVIGQTVIKTMVFTDLQGKSIKKHLIIDCQMTGRTDLIKDL